MPTFLTIAVPTTEYNEMIESVSKIKLSKRKAWKSWSKEASGQKTNIYYTSEPLFIHDTAKTHLYKKAVYTHNITKFYNLTKQSGLSQAVFKIKDIDVVPVISLDMELFLNEMADTNIAIDGHGEADNDVAMIGGMYELWAQNATGNHNRNHNISIPTKPGEPCRG